MLGHEFIRTAYLGGTFVALACGVVGWFTVLRGQVFAGDALSHVAFVGAIAAAVVGVDERVGLFALTLGLAATMAGLGRRAQADDVTIGVVFSWVLGIGVLLIAVLSTGSAGGDGLIVANTLFGSIFGLSAEQGMVAAAIGFGVALVALAIARPLLFASLDPELAAPGGAALQLTRRPYLGMALSGGIALAAMWGGIALSYAIPSLPPSTAIVALAVGAYALARVASKIASWAPMRKQQDRPSAIGVWMT
jgi:zinc/manganese transport system permease protein